MTSVSDLQNRWDNILVRHGERVLHLDEQTKTLQDQVDAYQKAPRKPGIGGFLSRIFNNVVKVWPLKYKIHKKHKEKEDLNSLLTSSADNIFNSLALICMDNINGGKLKSDFMRMQETSNQLTTAHASIQSAIGIARKAIELEDNDLRTNDSLTSRESKAQTQQALRSIQAAMKKVGQIQKEININKEAITDDTIKDLKFSNNLGFIDELSSSKSAHSFGDLLNLFNIKDLQSAIGDMQRMDTKIEKARRDVSQAQEQVRSRAVKAARNESPEVNQLCNTLSYWVPKAKLNASAPAPKN
jgi:hypothetical protein